MSGYNQAVVFSGSSGINPNFNDVSFWSFFDAQKDVDIAGYNILNVNNLDCQTLNALNLDISGNVDISGTLDVCGNFVCFQSGDFRGNFGASQNALIPSTRTLTTTPSTFTVQDVGGNWAIRLGSAPSTSDLLLNVSAGKTVIGQPAFNTGLKIYGYLDASSASISGSMDISNNLTVYNDLIGNYIQCQDLSTNILIFGNGLGTDLELNDFTLLGANQGDIFYSDNTGRFQKLPIGTAGQYLESNGTTPQWSGVPTNTLSQVLTAGNDATNQNISNLNTLGSATINNSGNITSGALIATSRVETNLIENYSGSLLTVDSPSVNISIDTSLNIYTPSNTNTAFSISDTNGIRLNTEITTIGKLQDISSTFLKVGNFDLTLIRDGTTLGYREPFNFFFNPIDQLNGSQFYCPNLIITNTGGSVQDSGTSTAMASYQQFGGYGFSRNWALYSVRNSAGNGIARMRIALDKAYFATEQHPVRVPSSYTENYYGLLLSSKSQYINRPTKTEAHVYASICEKEKDKNIYGVYTPYDFVMNSQDDNSNEEQIYSLFIPQKTPETKIGYSASGGEGQVWVCDIGGNIEAGDYLTSSKICGVAMKQSDSVFHNYTIFKSAFDCDFTPHLSEYPVHVVDASGERQWRNPEKPEEGFVYKMETYINPVYELEVHYDYYEIKGVLKYPFDFKTKQPLLVGKKFKAMLIGGVYQN